MNLTTSNVKTNYNYELIKDYLNGILDSETSKNISELIAKDETAKGIARGILHLEDRFGSDSDIDRYLDSMLDKNHMLIEDKIRSSKPFNILKIAASVAIISVSTILVYSFMQPDLSELLEDELAQPYDGSLILRDAESLTNFDRATAMYIDGEYIQAYELLKAENSPQATFYRGLSLLYAGNAGDAAIEFEKDELAQTRFTEQGRWYLAIAYLKMSQSDNATEIFEEIVTQESHFKQKEAQKLLDKLSDN